LLFGCGCLVCFTSLHGGHEEVFGCGACWFYLVMEFYSLGIIARNCSGAIIAVA
jgi:hypothetical protein